MTMHSVIGTLVAVAVPLWLVVEQVLKWRVLKTRPAPSRARAETRGRSKGAIPGHRRDMTGPTMDRKAS